MYYVQEVDVLYIWLCAMEKKGQDSSLNARVKDKLSQCLGARNIYSGQK
jgi:putative component of toxin-antitoxin plasmid stabilization module